jgi:hypothetical protein
MDVFGMRWADGLSKRSETPVVKVYTPDGITKIGKGPLTNYTVKLSDGSAIDVTENPDPAKPGTYILLD